MLDEEVRRSRARGASATEYLIALIFVGMASVAGYKMFGKSLLCRMAMATNALGTGKVSAACDGPGGGGGGGGSGGALAQNDGNSGPSGGSVCVGGVCSKPGESCFVAGTPVLTEEGPRPIESIEAGMRVLSRDAEGGELAFRPVVRTHARTTRSLVRLRVADGQGRKDTLEVTPEHLLSVDGRGWVAAGELEPGVDRLVDTDGAPLALVEGSSFAAEVPVYNFEVAESHTYYVGRLGIWAHNQCGGGNGGGGGNGNGTGNGNGNGQGSQQQAAPPPLTVNTNVPPANNGPGSPGSNYQTAPSTPQPSTPPPTTPTNVPLPSSPPGTPPPSSPTTQSNQQPAPAPTQQQPTPTPTQQPPTPTQQPPSPTPTQQQPSPSPTPAQQQPSPSPSPAQQQPSPSNNNQAPNHILNPLGNLASGALNAASDSAIISGNSVNGAIGPTAQTINAASGLFENWRTGRPTTWQDWAALAGNVLNGIGGPIGMVGGWPSVKFGNDAPSIFGQFSQAGGGISAAGNLANAASKFGHILEAWRDPNGKKLSAEQISTVLGVVAELTGAGQNILTMIGMSGVATQVNLQTASGVAALASAIANPETWTVLSNGVKWCYGKLCSMVSSSSNNNSGPILPLHNLPSSTGNTP